MATIPATLKFTVKDCDPTTGEPDSEEGYSDDYQLEDIDLSVSDYVQRVMKVFAINSLHKKEYGRPVAPILTAEVPFLGRQSREALMLKLTKRS